MRSLSKKDKNFYKYINSYTQLNIVATNLRKKFNKYNNEFNLLGFTTSDVLVTSCLRLFSQNLNQIRKQFLTNLYFHESLKINKLPDYKTIYQIEKKLNDKSLLATQIRRQFETSDKRSLHDSKQLKWAWLENYIIYLSKNKNKSKFQHLFGNTEKKFLSLNGYLIIPGVLSYEECNKLEKKILKLAIKEKQKKIAYMYGQGELQRIYNILGKDKIFQELICHPLVLKVMNYLFDRPTLHDKYYLSSFHANIIGKGGKEQVLHIDAAVPEPIPKWIIRANVNFLIHDYTKNNGATIIFPKSHKLAKVPPRYSDSNYKLLNLEAPKGSLIFWNGHLWHKSGSNITSHPRIGILGCFAASFLREMSLEENHFEVIPQKIQHSMSNELKRLIGSYHGIKKGSTVY